MSPAVEVLGTVLGGKYRIVRLLAQGGMGAVYEGEHVEIGHKVAIKVMKPELAQRAEALARFRREAQIAGTLGHDNICAVLDLGTTPEGSPYLVMPLLKGSSLAQALTECGPLPEERALDIAAQLLAALSAAHQVGVVHRDLKPDNVFLTQIGERADFIKVLDFGISKVLGAQREASALTQTGTLVGTPYYMAPEQARGLKDQDARVDVYAVGVILFEMLTGHLPFTGDEIGGVIIKIATEGFTRPSQLRPDLSPAVEGLVLRAMERDRDRRFPDAANMRAVVLGLLAGDTGTAAGGSIPVATGRTTPSTPAPIVGEAHRAVATELGQTTPFGWNASVTVRRQNARRTWLIAFAVTLALAGLTLAVVALSGTESPRARVPAAAAGADLPSPAGLAPPAPPTSEQPAPPSPSPQVSEPDGSAARVADRPSSPPAEQGRTAATAAATPRDTGAGRHRGSRRDALHDGERMSARRPVVCGIVALALTALGAVPAQAQPADPRGPNAAQQHFDEGVRLLRERDWAGALTAFEASRALRETASVVFNIAGCLRTLRRFADARRAYQRFLEIGTRPNQRVEAARAIDELAANVAALSVRVDVEGAEVTLDGRPLEHQPLDLDLGSEHVVEGRREGYRPSRMTVRPSEAGPLSITLALTPREPRRTPPLQTTVASVDPVDQRRPADPPPRDRYAEAQGGGTWPWILAGAALVVAGGAVTAYLVVTGGDEPTGDVTLHPR